MTPGRVMVIGATGQLGAVVVREFASSDVIAHGSASLDITDADAVADAVREAAPDVIINCAAFNNVDAAEDRPLEALALNAIAVRSLASAAEESGARFVHYSTDFVFDGAASSPYTESDKPAPQSTYAASKLLGEWLALDAPGSWVLRVESLFGTDRQWSGRRGTMDGILDGLLQGREVPVFTDRIVSPSYIVDIAAATAHLVRSDAAPGLYHCVNTGAATWLDVAEELARQVGVVPTYKRLLMTDVNLRAARPRFCALDNAKLAQAGFVMPTWQDALRRWLETRLPAA